MKPLWLLRFYRSLLWKFEFLARWDGKRRGYDIVQVGDRYEDCNYRILTCTEISYSEDYLYGVDENNQTWGCSPTHCGVEKVNE